MNREDQNKNTKSSPLKYNLAPPGGSHAIGVRRLMDSAMAVTTVLGELTEPSSLMVVEHCEVLPLADEPSIHFSIMYAITLSRSVGLSLWLKYRTSPTRPCMCSESTFTPPICGSLIASTSYRPLMLNDLFKLGSLSILRKPSVLP
ncbi:unnamed protein product [Bathycoccus prasinos]